ncbi:tyrosinase family protein [Agromyces sp. GXQ0307]|uniref:tyrosinase family protein n=1 Tax=Agromyces sp. GXQ0307 TaxID=3377835 RepID=UPI00383BD43A
MLTSRLFAGDDLLERIASGAPDRISQTQNRFHPAVGTVQQALLLWEPDVLPLNGADGEYGGETEAAVVRFKIEELGVANPFPDVGPLTVQRLDEIAAAAEQPSPAPVRVRHDIWALQPTADAAWHPFVDAYERAVAALRDPAQAAPARWDYQAALHGTPFATGDPLLANCQHGTWYFLPWHRIYLAHFERILIDVIAGMPEVDDDTKATWALPYWNYHRPATAFLPHPFRTPLRPDGAPNALFDPARTLVDTLIDPAMLDTSGWLDRTLPFSGPFSQATNTTFGGERTPATHRAAGGTGQLERSPHNAVHNAVGGNMLNPAVAGRDPVFWLHHANIDRLWEVWRVTQGVGRDEPRAAYLDEPFPFLELDGAVEPWHPADVADTAPLGYEYDDLSKPAPVFVLGVLQPEWVDALAGVFAPVPVPVGPGGAPVPPGPVGPGGGGFGVAPEVEGGADAAARRRAPDAGGPGAGGPGAGGPGAGRRAPGAGGPAAGGPAEPPTGTPAAPAPEPAPRRLERIGALDRTLRLSGGESPTLELPLDAPPPPVERAPADRGPFGLDADDAAAGAAEPPTRYFIRVEHVSVTRNSDRIYSLYLDPDGDDPEAARFVATLPTFGAERADEPDSQHGLSFTFEITEIVEDLIAAGTWNPSVARVTLRLGGEASDRSPDPELSIGSIDVFAG